MTNAARRPVDRVVTACEERRDTVLDAIRGAQRRISLSLFRGTDKQFFQELTAAAARGINVEVLVTSRAKGGKRKLTKLWERLEATGATVSTYNDPVVKYHAKYLVVDDGPALITSLNFTRKCFTRTCDAILITHDAEIVRSLRALLVADRDGQPLPEGLSDRLIIGPESARRRITTLIEGAASRVQVIDPKLSDPALLSLLNARRAGGIAVDIHGDSHFGALKSHGKVMLIDRKLAVIGSMALTALCLDFRREVAVVVDDPAALAVIEQLLGSIGAATGVSSGASATAAGGASC